MKIETLVISLEINKVLKVYCGDVISVSAGYNKDNPQEHLLLIRNFGNNSNKRILLMSPTSEIDTDIKFKYVCDVMYNSLPHFFFVEDIC